MKMLKIGLIFLMALSLAAISYAGGTDVTPGNKLSGSEKITSTAAKEKGPGIKAERGIKNILFGWVEIPKSIIQVTRDSRNPIWGITGGTLKGVGKALPRTVSGISDVATAPFYSYDQAPVKPDELKTNIQ